MMRMRAFTLVAAGALGMAPVLGQQPPKANPPAGKVRMIPLETCYATLGVGGCQFITDGGGTPYAFDLGELIHNHRAGASNVALVRGKDIVDAVQATRRIFAAGRRADTPVAPNPSDTKAEPLSLWLVAYFGMGPSTPGFGRVQAVEVRGQTICVMYTRAQALKATADVCHYYVWVPLGSFKAGTYALELFDADRKEVTLLRRVTIAEP
jgi:hypothetical protein